MTTAATIYLYMCISVTSLGEHHKFSIPEAGEGAGHVSYEFFDSQRENLTTVTVRTIASTECEYYHGNTCEAICFWSR